MALPTTKTASMWRTITAARRRSSSLAPRCAYEAPRALTEQTVEIPEALRCYIDFEAMAHDARPAGDLFTIKTDAWKVHVFSG
jgi:hypothetical protein